MIQLKDNGKKQRKEVKISDDFLNQIANKTLENFQKEGLFIFPADLSESNDLESSQKILETIGNELQTGNVMGILKRGEEELFIQSRFDDENNFFFFYMLEKVLHFNVTDFMMSARKHNYLNFLVFLFPYYLNKALTKGIYKEYRHFHYNDANIRGRIDVNRFLKEDLPFIGKIAYDTRERSSENAVIHLVRYTIDFLKKKGYDKLWLSDKTSRENVDVIVQNSQNYQKKSLSQILLTNIKKPLRHAYYHEYRDLQRLCIAILRRETVMPYQQNQQEVSGFLIDGAWLWEEYLATLLPEFEHPQNKAGKGGISVFQKGNGRKVYPDFYNRHSSIVLDAKYKRLETTEKGIARGDLFQLISYSYILETRIGGLLFPSNEKGVDNHIGKLNGYGGMLKKWSLLLPQTSSNYNDFVNQIQKSEKVFQEKITKALTEQVGAEVR
ncbi:3-isopropylmalate dehydrogenase [Streptococcus sp. ZY19097]|uniref:5-methylcytosine restriction system specificity protein McrC n=1 Tax=Streptococcus sp. ZY19097 TaxID=3231906 RepID=UPI003457A2B6